MFRNSKKNALALVAILAVVGSPAFATGTDFSSLTGAVDYSTVGAALLAVAALMVVPAVVKKGAKMVLSFIGR